MLAGVAGGIAESVGLSPIYVRAAFVSLSLAGGVGIILYVVLALVVPDTPDGGSDDISPPATRMQVAGMALMFVALMLILQAIGLWLGAVVWPTTLVVFGLAIAIETSGINYERSLEGVTAGRRSWWLVIGGLGMMVAGLVVVLRSLDRLQSFGVLAIALIVAIGGFMIVAGPWLWSLIEDLRTERRARIRSEEKAEVAAHLHDSVLQTLALIQRTDDPKKMVTLARSQERDLRSWLFDENSTGTDSILGALTSAATRVEAAHDVPVSVVVVGEASLPSDKQEALISAATEAMMNAAKHSGAAKVSVYAEMANGAIDVYVTDQGGGFDRDSVGEDRRGIRESIEARMQRHGGSATIESIAGEGTEVHLTMIGATS
ncbi:MAG: PspC domain-containing protein [Actinomycetia bacterium]|nr:PspC domain-containing protein [Actinomycetes bacterium]